MSNYFTRVGGTLSGLANAVCNGDGDTTISAYVGYREENDPSRAYDALRAIIDCTFFPVDGVEHCRRSYKADTQERYLQGWNIPRFVLAASACIVLFIPFWIIGLLLSHD